MNNSLKKIYNFLNDDTLYYAGSLSFFTIFSFLPILALLIFLMSQTQYFQTHIDAILMYILDFINPSHSSSVAKSINIFLNNIEKLGNIGIVYLFFVFIMFIKDYDYIASKIFDTNRRNLIESFFIYFIILFILPLAIIFLTIADKFLIKNYLQEILGMILNIFLLASIFKLSANKKTLFKYAIYSAIITIWIIKLTKFLFAYFIIYNTTYTTIYGAMSILLFMFLWIYIFWIIYLYGLKIFKALHEN